MNLKHKVTLVVGDWSHDGHSMTETFVVDSNLSKKELKKAYDAGVKKVGFDLSETVCEEYEDTKIREPEIRKLIAAGYEWELGENGEVVEEGEEGHWLSAEEFTDMWLFIAKLGNPSLTYKVGNCWEETINIGGYGLFGS